MNRTDRNENRARLASLEESLRTVNADKFEEENKNGFSQVWQQLDAEVTDIKNRIAKISNQR